MGGRIVRRLAWIAALATATVQAGAAESPPPAARGEYYLRVSIGYGLSEVSNLHVRRPASATDLSIGDVSWDDNSLSGPSARYTDVRFGHFLGRRPWMGFAVDFLHFKIFADVARPQPASGTSGGVPIPPGTVAPMSDYVQRYDVANGVNLIPASFIARYRARRGEKYPDGRLQPYGGFGLGPTLLYTHSTVDGQSRDGPYEFGPLGAVAFGGLQLHVARRWELSFEYKRTHLVADGSIDAGTSRTRLRSNHFTLGGGYHW